MKLETPAHADNVDERSPVYDGAKFNCLSLLGWYFSKYHLSTETADQTRRTRYFPSKARAARREEERERRSNESNRKEKTGKNCTPSLFNFYNGDQQGKKQVLSPVV